MLKKLPVFICLSLSSFALPITANAAIVDYGVTTLDTATNLRWLDLTETVGRTYNDVSSKFAAGQEFEGWRYATQNEVQVLWEHLGLTGGLTAPISVTSSEFPLFNAAVALLGDTVNGQHLKYDYGTKGITADGHNDFNRYVNGMAGPTVYNQFDSTAVTGANGSYLCTAVCADSSVGSWLVQTNTAVVPVPAAGWLLMSALIALFTGRRFTGQGHNRS